MRRTAEHLYIVCFKWNEYSISAQGAFAIGVDFHSGRCIAVGSHPAFTAIHYFYIVAAGVDISYVVPCSQLTCCHMAYHTAPGPATYKSAYTSLSYSCQHIALRQIAST